MKRRKMAKRLEALLNLQLEKMNTKEQIGAKVTHTRTFVTINKDDGLTKDSFLKRISEHKQCVCHYRLLQLQKISTRFPLCARSSS